MKPIDFKHKTLVTRTVLILLYLGLALLMLTTGRSHTVLIDNKNGPDGSYQAVKAMKVSINKGEAVEFLKGDRDKFTVKGQKLNIHLTFFDGTPETSFSLSIPFTYDAVLVSIPKLLAKVENPMEFFDLYAQNKEKAKEDETPVTGTGFGF